MNVGPLGKYHPRDLCAFCGADERTAGELYETTIRTTRARGLLCRDSSGCLRRRRREGRVDRFLRADDPLARGQLF